MSLVLPLMWEVLALLRYACKEQGMVNVASTSKIVYAHGVFWLRLMENFAEHQKPFGPKTQKKK